MEDFATSMAAYEAEMASVLGDDFHPKGIERRHEKMRESAFLFLRATCWRWAEASRGLCPEAYDGPVVAAVGDAHAGNFGLWRDAGARLVWGVNDYDEAARLPYRLDLVRLCASIILADPAEDAADIAEAILAGYRAGLNAPRPHVLERDHLWLRDAFAASDADREDFWKEIETAKPRTPSAPLRHALVHALPDRGLPVVFARRSAGAGSLGRARFVAFGSYRGGPVAMEAKARLRSCWSPRRKPGLARRLAAGLWRSPDPELAYGKHYVVRRLAPDSRKLDMAKIAASLQMTLIEAMGFELACVHAGLDPVTSALIDHLESDASPWLGAAGARVAAWTTEEYEAFKRSKPPVSP